MALRPAKPQRVPAWLYAPGTAVIVKLLDECKRGDVFRRQKTIIVTLQHAAAEGRHPGEKGHRIGIDDPAPSPSSVLSLSINMAWWAWQACSRNSFADFGGASNPRSRASLHCRAGIEPSVRRGRPAFCLRSSPATKTRGENLPPLPG